MKTSNTPAPLSILIGLVFSSAAFAQTGIIVTVAGTGVPGTAGVGGPAASAQLTSPAGIAVDSADNLYIADIQNNRVVRVDAVSGILTVVAGNGAAAFGGDGGPAVQASINNPYSVSLDAAGDLFITEFASSRIRRVDSVTGIITTVAGNGTAAYSGDGGLALAASLRNPTNVALDSLGNLFIADSGNARIRRVDAQSAVITTVAGNGTFAISPDGSTAASAPLSPPLGVSVDRSGSLLVSEFGSNTIRRVDSVTGILTTFAGNGTLNFTGDGVPATAAAIGKNIANVAMDSAGNYFFADSGGRIRRVDGATGLITTAAGNGTGAQSSAAAGAGYSSGPGCYTVAGDNGPASIATIDGPWGVAVTSNGNLIFSDAMDCRVRRVYLPSPYPYTNTVVTGSAATAPPGQPVSFTATVSPIGASGVPTGSVVFVDAPSNGFPDSGTVVGYLPLSGGSAFLTLVPAAGNHLIVAYYSGDSSYNGSGSPGAPLIVTQGQKEPMPVVSLFENHTTVPANTSAAFAVMVTPPAGSSTQPTGSVQLNDNGNVLATNPLVNGAAQFQASFSTSGTHSLAAVYFGDTNYSAAVSANVFETVIGPTTTTLTTSMSPSAYGQSVTWTASVSPASATGSVEFLDGGVLAGVVPVSGGIAVTRISTSVAGAHTFTAVYSGDAADTGSTSAPVAQLVATVTPSVVLTSNLNPALAALSVTFVATITPGSNGVGVQFLDGQTVLGTVALANSTASFSTASLHPGAHSITAVCVGDGNLGSATSAVLTQTIQAPTTLSLTSPGAASTWGQPVTFTASLAPSAATGTVQFTDGAASIGAATIANGVASLTMPSLSVGTHSISASYNGDGVYLASSSTAWVQTVNTAPSSVVAISSLNPSVAGQLIFLSATVSPAAATGSVQFLDGATVVGLSNVVNGTASLMNSALAAGSHSITAQYSGDGNYAGSTSAAMTQTVKTASSTTIGASVSPVVYGQQVSLLSYVTPSAATGTVQFLEGATTLGTVPLIGGIATFPISTLSTGTHLIVAAYSGDANYGSSSSALMTLTVGKASPTAAVTSSLTPSVSGQSVTLTATLSPVSVTGTVQFLDGATSLGTVTISGGVATLSISSLSAGSHSITASYSGDGNYNSALAPALTQTVKATTATILTANNASIMLGQAVQLTASVAPATATGTVQFLDGATALGTATISSGAAVLTASTLAVGSHTLTAVYSGDGNNTASTSAAVVVTVSKATSTVTATSSLNPAVTGQSVTFAATVTPSAATGTVQFLDGATALGTATISGGMATLNTSSLSAGSHSITASYSGDGNYNSASSAALIQTVKATTATALSANNPSIVLGQTVQLTASVAPGTATGTVQFLDGGSAIGSVSLTSGAAVLTASNLAVGSHTLTAVYSGDGNNTASTSAAVVVTVSKSNSMVTATSSLNPAVTGQSVTFAATVTPSAATGTVQFLDGATALGTATISSGVATLSTSSLSAGSHSITASYSGDGSYNSAWSAALAETVKATTATALTANNTSIVLGQTVQLTASVAPATATGTVQFLDGGSAIGSVSLISGAAVFMASTLAVGSHTLTAIYSGDGNNVASTSAAVLVTVSKATSTVAVTSSLNPAVTGQTVTFTAMVTPSTATGTVQFKDGSTLLGSATIAGGTGAFATSTLAAGSHSITAVYSGDGNYNSASSAALTQTVKATTATALTANSASIVLGQSVQLSASVAPATASGTVQFLDGGSAIGSVNLSSGAAVLTASNLAVGSHSLTAVYSGDGNNTASTSATVVVTVSKATSTVAVTSSLNPAVAGQAVTFTAKVTPSAATGTEQFKDGSTVLGSATIAGGTATFATSTLAVGSHSITAVYSGDGNYNASTSSALTETISAALPGAPSSLTATAASASQINLSWTASATSGVTYNVYSSATSGFTPSSGNRIAAGVSTTSYAHTGLAASSSHFYVVTAQNAGGESAGSNQASATTQSGGGCHVAYTVTTQWNVGFGTAITIQNTGTAPINGWNLTWAWAGNQQITQAWDANYSQTGANASLTNLSYDSTIAAGTTISGIGFNGSYSGTNTAPAAFYVNGTLCH